MNKDVVVISNGDDDPDKIKVMHYTTATPPPLSNRPGVCMGVRLDFPPGHSPYNSYPVVMHDTSKLEWDLKFCRGILYLCSWDCKRSTMAGSCCDPCHSILHQRKLQGIIRHINNGTPPNSPHQY